MRLALCLLLASCVASDDRMLEANSPDDIEQTPLQPASQSDFASFIACIHYDDFVASNMTTAWSADASCTSCHAADGMFSNDPVRFFDDLKHRTYVQVQFFTWDRTTETVEVNEETIPRIGKAVAPYASHPKFDAHKGIQATFDLHDRTNTRLAAGTCP